MTEGSDPTRQRQIRRRRDNMIAETFCLPESPAQEPARIARRKKPQSSLARVTSVRIAPDIPFRWFKVAVSFFKQQDLMPNRVDRSAWASRLHGADIQRVLSTFCFLDLVTDAGRPTGRLHELVRAYGTDGWSTALNAVLQTAYAPIFAADLSTVSAGGLFDAFRNTYGTESEGARKAVNFLIHAARDAEIPLSPFLTANFKTRKGGSVQASHGTGKDIAEAGSTPRSGNMRRHTSIPADATIDKLLARLPEFDPTWTDELQLAWFTSFLELIQTIGSGSKTSR